MAPLPHRTSKSVGPQGDLGLGRFDSAALPQDSRKTPGALAALGAKLAAHVDRSAGPAACWPWRGSKDRCGYGILWLAGQPRSYAFAHRVAFFSAGGTLGPRQEVAHAVGCLKACCNPAHLRAATRQENLADRLADGTLPRGEKNGRAKVTADLVVSLRARYAAGERSGALAREAGLAVRSLKHLLTGVNWAHVPGAVRLRAPSRRAA